MNGAQHSVVIDGHTHIFTKDRKGNNGIVYKVYENTVDGTFRLMSQVQLPDGSIRWVWESEYKETVSQAFWSGRELQQWQQQQGVQHVDQHKRKGDKQASKRPAICNKTHQGGIKKPQHSGHKGRQTPTLQAGNARGILQVMGGITVHSGGTLNLCSPASPATRVSPGMLGGPMPGAASNHNGPCSVGTSTARMAVLLDASTPGGQTVPFGMAASSTPTGPHAAEAGMSVARGATGPGITFHTAG